MYVVGLSKSKDLFPSNILVGSLLHSPPLLLVDNVLSFEPFKWCQATKVFGDDTDWIFSAHFPGSPLLPGSLQIEAYTQAAALVLLAGFLREDSSSNVSRLLLVGISGARFYTKVSPGAVLVMNAELKSRAHNIATIHVAGFVDEAKVSECQVIYKEQNTQDVEI